jgi:hypothetical protein
MTINPKERLGTQLPDTNETQITTESTPETRENFLSRFRENVEQKAALGGLERGINNTGSVAIALGAGAALFACYLAVAEHDFTPGEVESQVEVVDQESR